MHLCALCVLSGSAGKEENMKRGPWWLWKQFPAICFREPQAGKNRESYLNNQPTMETECDVHGKVVEEVGEQEGKSYQTKTWEFCATVRSPPTRPSFPRAERGSWLQRLSLPHPQWTSSGYWNNSQPAHWEKAGTWDRRSFQASATPSLPPSC